MILVSSANNIVHDTECILRGRSFIQIMTNMVPSIGTCLNVPNSEGKKMCFFFSGDVTSVPESGSIYS